MSVPTSRLAALPVRSPEPSRPASLRPGPTEAGLSRPPLGNQAFQRLLLSGAIQAKLAISQPGDSYEREADQVADAVMRMPEPGAPEPEITPLSTAGVQRKCAACEAGGASCAGCSEEEEQVQRKAESTESSLPSTDESIVPKSGGQVLTPEARSFFEPRFGRDFTDVRVHTGSAADASARSVSALAYTVGSDVVFRSGQYSPETAAGRRLLAHELTHVVQQNGRAGGAFRAVQRKCGSKTREQCSDEEALAAVCIGETGNVNSRKGKQGVMNVVKNRTGDRTFGNNSTIRGQAFKILDAETIDPPPALDRLENPIYSECHDLAKVVRDGSGGDPTGGAIFFDQCCERQCDQFCTGYLGDGSSLAHFFARRATPAEHAACRDRAKNPGGSCPNFCGEGKTLLYCDRRCCDKSKQEGPVPPYKGMEKKDASQNEAAPQEPAQSSAAPAA